MLTKKTATSFSKTTVLYTNCTELNDTKSRNPLLFVSIDVKNPYLAN